MSIRITLDVTNEQLLKIAELLQNQNKSVEQISPSPAVDAFQKAQEEFEEPELAKGLNGRMIPWDERIHAKSKTKLANGQWRLIQGIDREQLVPRIEAELSEVDVVASTPTPPAPSEPTPLPTIPTHPPVPETFVDLLPRVTAAKTSGALTDEKIDEACKKLGISTFGLIATRPDLIPQMVELLEV